MGVSSLELDILPDSYRDETTRWHLVIPLLGVLLLTGAIVRSFTSLIGTGGFLEAVLDLLLLSTPGLVMLYVGRWLPTTPIPSELYPRIVTWVFGGIAVMSLVVGLRILHPGVTVNYTFGTQAVLLSIGSIAGLGIGVHEARALTHAQMVEEQNERLKDTEERLEEAVTQLEASNDRLEQFAYAASHDLQEPLRMVTNYLQLVERRYGDELDEEGEEFIEYAVDGADRMRAMIDGLLEYSRVGTQGGQFDAVDLDAVLDDVLTDLQLKIDETEAEITREPLPTVDGDARQLQQLFQNLVSNAIDYSGDEPPRIHVSATDEGTAWMISVRDEGIGMDPDETDRIFGIFQRLHSIDEHAGSGIGLALCKRIIERHDGEIWVESEPDDGSTFRFTLRPADHAASVADAGTRSRGSTDGRS